MPFIWVGPGVAKGAVVDTTVSLLDTYPTLVELAGLPANGKNESLSLASILNDPSSARDRVVLQTVAPENFSQINQKWRYIYEGHGEEQLYDLTNDPHEHHNLALTADQTDRMNDFRSQHRKEFAPQAMGIKARNLRPRFSGETFEWHPWTAPSTKKRKK